jgi:hypothetical protein
MRWNSRSLILCILFIALAAVTADPRAEAQKPKNGVDVPISLAVGTVKTPEFIAKHDLYLMKIEAQWLLPAVVLRCKMGFGVVPPTDKCRAQAVLEVEWRVLDGENVIAHGSAGGISDQFEADKDYIARYIGQFRGQSKHKYVVELTFTKDGSSLNVTNPRLVVSPPDFAF